jgi:hypothetical protein
MERKDVRVTSFGKVMIAGSIRKSPRSKEGGSIRGHRNIISIVIERNVGILKQGPSVHSPRFKCLQAIEIPTIS